MTEKAKEPWATNPEQALAEKPEKPRREPPPAERREELDESAIVAALAQWEQRLQTLAPQSGDQEYGRVAEKMRQIGVRQAQRVAASHQNRCANCNNVLPLRGPADTIPLPAPELTLGWRNQYACSTRCADELRAAMHEREMKRLAAA